MSTCALGRSAVCFRPKPACNNNTSFQLEIRKLSRRARNDLKRTFTKRGCRRYAQQQQALPIRKTRGHNGRIILNCSGLLAILRQADGEN